MAKIVMSIDLAAKMSAYCVVGSEGIVTQGDSWGSGTKTQDEFVSELVDAVKQYSPEVCACEDIPHGIKSVFMVKKVLRLQGRLEDRFFKEGFRDLILWVPPVTWKGRFKLNGRDTAKLIEPKAAELGYEPPIDLKDYKGKLTAARKIRTDYAAAYLMARWLYELDDYDVKNTERSGE